MGSASHGGAGSDADRRAHRGTARHDLVERYSDALVKEVRRRIVVDGDGLFLVPAGWVHFMRVSTRGALCFLTSGRYRASYAIVSTDQA